MIKLVWSVRIEGWHPHRLNQIVGVHWATKARRRKADDTMISLHCRMAGVPPAEGKRRVRLLVTLGPRQRGGDVDSYHKSTLDALVNCGAIRGDGKEWVEVPPVEYDRGEVRAFTIRLEDI